MTAGLVLLLMMLTGCKKKYSLMNYVDYEFVGYDGYGEVEAEFWIDADGLYDQVAGLLDDGVTKKELRVVPEKILAEKTRAELADLDDLDI